MVGKRTCSDTKSDRSGNITSVTMDSGDNRGTLLVGPHNTTLNRRVKYREEEFRQTARRQNSNSRPLLPVVDIAELCRVAWTQTQGFAAFTLTCAASTGRIRQGAQKLKTTGKSHCNTDLCTAPVLGAECGSNA